MTLLVALAVALGIAVSAQDRALRQGSAEAAAKFKLIVGAPGSETQLVLSAVYLQPAAIGLVPPAVLAELERTRTAKFASPIGFGDSWRGHPVVGVTPAFVRHLASGAIGEGNLFEHLYARRAIQIRHLIVGRRRLRRRALHARLVRASAGP